MHSDALDTLKNKVVLGDVLDVLNHVPDESVHLTFTSPPYYNARAYSSYLSYESYLDSMAKVFNAVHRITKAGRFLVVNTSPVITPRISRSHASKRHAIPFDLHARISALGWEFVDDIIWVKPEPSVKNRNAGFSQHRKPLGYKPNSITEYVMVYRKQSDKLLDWNMAQYDNETQADSKVDDGYNSSNVWRIAPRSAKNHSAVFPAELCKRIIQYYSYKGDLVFDPFGGSGTLGQVAYTMGRYFFMTEYSETYFKQMHTGFNAAPMFEDFTPTFLTLSGFKKQMSRNSDIG